MVQKFGGGFGVEAIEKEPAQAHSARTDTFTNTHRVHIAMDRKNITIREDQSAWIEQEDVNLSQFVQEAIDEQMSPTEEELAQAYRENAEHAAETTEQWSNVSTEANQHLGSHPDSE